MKNVTISDNSSEDAINIIESKYFLESIVVENSVSDGLDSDFSQGLIKQPKFINVIIEVNTHLPILDLMSVLIFIEEKLERKRNKKNDPRTCDIDIIDYNKETLNFKYKNFDLVVPHKELALRNFVLFPLQEIAPNWIHPKTKDSIDVLINKLSNEDKKSILKIKKS